MLLTTIKVGVKKPRMGYPTQFNNVYRNQYFDVSNKIEEFLSGKEEDALIIITNTPSNFYFNMSNYSDSDSLPYSADMFEMAGYNYHCNSRLKSKLTIRYVRKIKRCIKLCNMTLKSTKLVVTTLHNISAWMCSNDINNPKSRAVIRGEVSVKNDDDPSLERVLVEFDMENNKVIDLSNGKVINAINLDDVFESIKMPE